MFADVDTLIEEHTKEQRLARFRGGKRPHEDSTSTEQAKRTQPSPGTGDPGPKRVWYGQAAEEQSVRVDDAGTVYFGQNQGSLFITRSGESANCTPDCYARLLAAMAVGAVKLARPIILMRGAITGTQRHKGPPACLRFSCTAARCLGSPHPYALFLWQGQSC